MIKNLCHSDTEQSEEEETLVLVEQGNVRDSSSYLLRMTMRGSPLLKIKHNCHSERSEESLVLAAKRNVRDSSSCLLRMTNHGLSLRGLERRSNPVLLVTREDCFTTFAMTNNEILRSIQNDNLN